MKGEFVTTGRVEGGVFKIRNRPQMEVWANFQRDGEYTVIVDRLVATRNLEQNALYHVGYVKPLAEFTGYTPSEMHAYLKARFLPAHKRKMKTMLLHNQHGEVIDEFELDESSTTKLSRLEFGDYLKEIEVFAASLGVVVGSNREAA